MSETTTYRVDVQITAPVYPTEVEARVAEAIQRLFPATEPELQHGEMVAECHEMERFSELLHRQEILDTARGALFGGREGTTLAFDLKKQAAYEGRVNFAVGDPAELGDLHVRVRVEEPDVESYVDQVAPPTEDGVPVEHRDQDR
jgi:predicted RNA binding protein with dsRBD fold (UPF0201 family)